MAWHVDHVLTVHSSAIGAWCRRAPGLSVLTTSLASTPAIALPLGCVRASSRLRASAYCRRLTAEAAGGRMESRSCQYSSSTYSCYTSKMCPSDCVVERATCKDIEVVSASAGDNPTPNNLDCLTPSSSLTTKAEHVTTSPRIPQSMIRGSVTGQVIRHIFASDARTVLSGERFTYLRRRIDLSSRMQLLLAVLPNRFLQES